MTKIRLSTILLSISLLAGSYTVLSLFIHHRANTDPKGPVHENPNQTQWKQVYR